MPATGSRDPRILEWLGSLDDQDEDQHQSQDWHRNDIQHVNKKRKRGRGSDRGIAAATNGGPPSPPITSTSTTAISTHEPRASDPDSDRDSHDMAGPTPTKKRRRNKDNDRGDGDGDGGDYGDDLALPDLDQTPRAAPAPPLSEASSSQRSSSYMSGASSVSRTSSPTKQLRQMELIDHGFSRDKLSARRLPPPLAELLRDIEDLSAGVGAVAASLRSQIADSQSTLDSSAFRAHVFSDAPSLPTVLPHKVLRIMERANRCELRMEDEASWNMEVHHHILRAVCRPGGKAGIVDFVSCTSAKISSEYRARLSPGKAIDFCICIDPSRDNDTVATRSIDLARAVQPGQSINHTDYAPLANMPIAVSIETKRGSENWSQALLQMGVWQAAQLRSLQSLHKNIVVVGGDNTDPGQAAVDGSGAHEQSKEDDSPVFCLPGLIIQGHDWSFVLSVRDGSRSVLLTKVAIGTTESPLGIYKILAVVARLVRWSEEVYWPAFKTDILGMPG